MTRGDVVTVAMQGGFGKLRPALVIQSDQFSGHPSVTVLPLTSTLVAAPFLRIPLDPTLENGLEKPSQIMVDKAATVARSNFRQTIGRIDANTLVQVDRCLAVFLGMAR